jgi:hypothetical protein
MDVLRALKIEGIGVAIYGMEQLAGMVKVNARGGLFTRF